MGIYISVGNAFRDGVVKTPARILIKSYRLFPISKATIKMKNVRVISKNYQHSLRSFSDVA